MTRTKWPFLSGAAGAAPGGGLRGYTLAAVAVGLAAIVIFSATAQADESFLARAGASIALGLGAIVLGLLLGFVFGIPRTLQHDLAPEAAADAAGRSRIAYQINTNLEQISDWLTKIIIGVGLIELGSIGRWLYAFSSETGAGFGSGVLGTAYVLGLLVYFAGGGFLLGYLWTRLYFGLAIKEADQGLVERRIEKVEAEIRADHEAVLLVARQLSGGAGESGVKEEDLAAAVARATRLTRTRIFYDASAARRDPERRERAIPVFRALIAADTGGQFHRNHAELGYALKDKAQPDWEAAEQALARAIEIRDRIGQGGFGEYEFNRARSRLALGRPKDEIVADLSRAGEDAWVRHWSLDDFRAWMKENGVTARSLGFD